MATGSSEFAVWVMENGGDEALVRLLKENGFTSKLSLGHLDLDAPDASSFLEKLNYGQRCLLKGLTKLCSPDNKASCSTATVASKALARMVNKGENREAFSF